MKRLLSELIFRGLNPEAVEVRHALLYNEYRSEFYDWQRELMISVAKEVFPTR